MKSNFMNFMKLAQITPANRSTLATKHNSSSTSQLFSEDQLSRDTKVVDMTDDVAIHGHLKEHTFKSLGLKKAKLLDRSKDAVGLDDVSSKSPQNIKSGALARYQGEGSTPQSKKSTIEKACGKNEGTCEKSEGQESNSDSLLEAGMLFFDCSLIPCRALRNKCCIVNMLIFALFTLFLQFVYVY